MEHKGTQRLETGRLVLRRLEERDAGAMLSNWAGDECVTRYLTWPAHTDISVSQAVLADWVSQYPKADYYQWGIVPKDSGDEPIGSISVVHMDERTKCVEIGYCIGKKWWHQGITTEAVKAVIEFFFTRVGAERVQARHDPNNPHSGGVMKKRGMTYEGTMRRCDVNNTGICDVCYYSILKDEWKK